jgi:hypothetical protein
MYSCRQASRIASDGLDRKLTVKEWIHLKMHLFVCSMCRNFEQNLRMLERAMRHIGSDDVVTEPLSAKDMETIRTGLGARLQATDK